MADERGDLLKKLGSLIAGVSRDGSFSVVALQLDGKSSFASWS
jgi:hypothetical protein